MLMNRFGPSFATLCQKDILMFDLNGNMQDHDPAVDAAVNDTILLHSVIHQYNPDVLAVVHTHPTAAVTWSAFRRVPEPYDQESCMLVDEIAIVEEQYSGLATTQERVLPFARAIATKPAVLLPNHGAITTGPFVQLAMFRMLLLEAMCARQLSVATVAQATGLKPSPINHEIALATKKELSRIRGIHSMWKDYLQRLRQSDPDLFESSKSFPSSMLAKSNV
jgi:ribulose-5-phosphate 4-epimerase/fuculose-1-phosphate aldolase